MQSIYIPEDALSPESAATIAQWAHTYSQEERADE